MQNIHQATQFLPEEPGRVLAWLNRYRDFLLSPETLIAAFNGITLLTGFILTISGNASYGRWFYLASALVGSIPLLILTSKALFIRHDITAGFMASVAMIAAIITSEYSAAALVVFMFAIGDWLENLTAARANNALRDLSGMVPTTVTLLRNGSPVEIPISQVMPGDRVLVRSGTRIGVDGAVAAGSASVNQAAITGESLPVEKQVGDEVYAGSMNELGVLEISVDRVGEETTLGQIIRLVRDAQNSQAPVQRIANKIARVLVPITFGIALIVFLITGELIRAITVLVVVCPCALVLATPTAVVAAIGNAAGRGMLVKSGAVIELIGRVDVVAFDKTGTLTSGKPAVQSVICLDGFHPDQLLCLAGALEHFSEHPIGRSVVYEAQNRSLPLPSVTDIQIKPGFGIAGQVGDNFVTVGNGALMKEMGIAVPHEFEQHLNNAGLPGQTAIAVAVDGSLRGWITLVDPPRPEARAMLADLKRIGIRELVMISGDHPAAAHRIANEIGIDRVYASILPQDKLRIIRELQAAGKKVAFVGDGINDAPALASSDVGIAMGLAGSDIALETASIGLMADELERIPQIIDLSRKTLRVIRQNVIFSMGMNLLSVVLGSLGLIGPALGALMHETSAIPVLANSARLIKYRANMVK